MSIAQKHAQSPPDRTTDMTGRPWWRLFVLSGLLVVSVVNYILLRNVAPPNNPAQMADTALDLPFLQVWIVAFLPYFVACAYVLVTPLSEGRWLKAELAIILLGAVLLRVILLPVPPVLSRDSWRYLWDAKVTLSGFSPYVYKPVDPALRLLVDNVLFPNMRYRTAPTIYPPGAQAVYLLSYLIGKSNLVVLKSILCVFDLATCVALMVLLQRKGIDPRRALLYAWSPLPIVEFAINGHIDAFTLTVTLLAWLSADNTSLGGRMLTGFLVGLSALTKIYPILLLAIIVPDLLREARVNGRIALARLRGSSYALVLTCLLTIALGYLPYLILGHGQVLGYFSTFTNQQGQDAGVINQALQWLGKLLQLKFATLLIFEHVVELLSICAVTLVVFVLRLCDLVSREMATLLLFGVILAISSHVFPWYTTILLLWIPALLVPAWTRTRRQTGVEGGKSRLRESWRLKGWLGGLSGKGLAIVAAWYFACVSILSYFPAPGVTGPLAQWTTYYRIAYDPLVIAFAVAALIGIIKRFWLQKEVSHDNH